MYRHKVEPSTLALEAVTLSGESARHLAKVLRVTEGCTVECFDGRGRTRLYAVAGADGKSLMLHAQAEIVCHPKPLPETVLFACITKGDRMTWTVEKAVELGAAVIVPVISARTIVRLDSREAEAKQLRWQRVAEEAARQCGAVYVPEIRMPQSLALAAEEMATCDAVLVAALTPDAPPVKGALAALSAKKMPQKVGWWSGPEGDFTEEELRLLLEKGARPVNLGTLVLRAETAALYGLAVLNCFGQEG